jgi:molecular chaperone GrpE
VGTLEKEMAVKDSLKNVYEGINMTNDSLLKTFAKHGLIKIDALGQKFDPNLHEAVFEEPAEKVKYGK